MKKIYMFVSLAMVLHLVSCQEMMKDSLNYTSEDGLELSKVFKLDSMVCKGTYWYKEKAVSSSYMVNSKYYLLAIRLDSVSPNVKFKLRENMATNTAGIYSTIFGDKINTNYSGQEIRKNYPVNLITCISDGAIMAGVSSDSITDFHTQLKELVLQFNNNKSAQLYMEPDNGTMHADVAFYRNNGEFYFLFMSARDTIKPGTLRKLLFSKPEYVISPKNKKASR